MTTVRIQVLLPVAALVLLGVIGWLAWSSFGSDAAEGGQERLRYANISVALPDDDGGDHPALRVAADYAPPESGDKPGGGPIVVVSYPETGKYLVIDALTGLVVSDRMGSEDRAEADATVGSVRVEREPAPAWPVGEVVPSTPRRTHGEVSYIPPDPNSGFFVLPATADGPEGAGTFLFVHNGRSRMTIDGGTGEIDESFVVPQDRVAFERFAASIVVRDVR